LTRAFIASSQRSRIRCCSPPSAARTFMGLASRARRKLDSPSQDVRFAHWGPSPDSDFDLRGAHVLPLEKAVGPSVVEKSVER